MSKKRISRSKSLLMRIVRLPRRLVNTRIRLSIGLSAGVLTLVLTAQLFNVIPNPNRAKMEARKLQTETLALTGSALVNTRTRLDEFQRALEHAVDRDDDLLSIGLRSLNDKLAIEIGDHQKNWVQPEQGHSNDQFMFVPIFRGRKQVSQLELRYRPLVSVSSWFHSHTAKLAGFLVLTSFLIFNLILNRTLKQLDPRGAVPQRVREALDNMAEGLVIVERTGAIMLANSKFASLVGISSDDLIGTNCSEFEWKSNHEQLPWERVVVDKTSVSEATLQITVNDIERTFSVSAAPVLGSKGSCRGVMITFDDITSLEASKRDLVAARKAADDANEAKTRFLSRMSHEIRTPMNAIIGYTDILRQGVANKTDQHQYLSTIHASGDHLLNIINDILDLSKIEAGQMTIEQREFDLIPLFSQVVRTLKFAAEKKNIALDFVILGKIPESISSDETRLRQILINIMGNAIKFTHEGRVTAIVSMTQESADGMLEIDVVDTGIGMPKSALEKIFNPFSQADDSVTRNFGGTGLGLAISKQLSEAMGGGIGVRSNEGVGTVFTISINPGNLPDGVSWVTSKDIASAAEKRQTKTESSVRFDAAHILVVDDTSANRDIASLLLKRLELTSEHAENGQIALDLIAKNHYDVVLMDMSMPVMDGMTATGILRESGSKVPVVALTAMVSEEEKKRCMEGGCDAFLAKPIRLDGLVDVLSQFLIRNDVSDTSGAKSDAGSDQTRAISGGAALASGTMIQCSSTADVQKSNSLKTSTAELQPVETNDDIDSSLLATLASLGIENDVSQVSKPGASPVADLILPDVVNCSLPLDEDMFPIVEGFTSRLPARLEEFTAAWQAGEIGKLRDLGHWLAGAAATVGFDDFVDPARELEYGDGSDGQRTEQLIAYVLELANRIELKMPSG